MSNINRTTFAVGGATVGLGLWLMAKYEWVQSLLTLVVTGAGLFVLFDYLMYAVGAITDVSQGPVNRIVTWLTTQQAKVAELNKPAQATPAQTATAPTKPGKTATVASAPAAPAPATPTRKPRKPRETSPAPAAK